MADAPPYEHSLAQATVITREREYAYMRASLYQIINNHKVNNLLLGDETSVYN